MRIYLVLLSLSFFILNDSPAFSQEVNPEHFCGAKEAHDKQVQLHPEILQQEAELEDFTRQFAAAYHGNVNRSGPIVIPIVFHIIHQGGPENISDEQVRDEVRILNRDYNKQNADTAAVTDSTLKSVIASIGIQFRLANKDPYGNPTNGIDRIYSVQTFMGNDFSKMNTWPREKYLNVWVVKSMENGVAGYAYYPSAVSAIYTTPSQDGVIILSQYIGSIGTSSPFTSRALTHEIGHYLNLKHTWGDSNNPGVACGDDDVNDTPITKGWLRCPSNAQSMVCRPGIVENYQNYMDYSYCSVMFTEGQKIRMLAALNSDRADRNNLYTPANLAATGTDDDVYTPAAPQADFGVTKRYVCVGDNITFLDASSSGAVDTTIAGGAISEYNWEFPNAIPSTSTLKNPVVEFESTGWQPVYHSVTNSVGTSVKRDTFRVYVGYPQALYQAPFYEGFEDPNIFQNDWAAINYDENVTSFKQINYSASHSGTGSAMVNNYFSRGDHDIDEIMSPAFDLSGLSNSQMTMTFYYSLASANQYFMGLTDSLSVSASINCGGTWIDLYKKGGANIVNAGYIQGYFTPTHAQAYWKYVKLTLPATLKQSAVRFRFQVFSAAYGNNFYIDDINIGAAPTGVEDLSVVGNATLFPNPTEGDAMLNLDMESTGKVDVKVYDITGKEVLNVFEGTLNEGENRLAINGSSALSSGVYLVNIKAGESTLQKKLVVSR